MAVGQKLGYLLKGPQELVIFGVDESPEIQ